MTVRLSRRARPLVALSAVLLMAGAPVHAASAPVAAWSKVTKKCVVKDLRIKENSGMARSSYRRQVLFAHNDSGGGPQFFALGRRCGTRAVFDLPGAPARDWEDMAVGPKHTLWFGDIGGNNPREVINVVRVKEPKRLTSRTLSYTAFELTYPDGVHNAESLMIRPRTGRLFITTKAATGAAIYRAPLTLKASGTNRLTKVADAPAGRTGADFSRDGKHFVLRGYKQAYVYSSIRDARPVDLDLPAEHKYGEAVAFARGGSLYFGAERTRQWLWKAKP